MIRAVVDSSVIVSAFIGRPDAAPAQVLQAACERRLQLVMSPQLVSEALGVLKRPKFSRWATGDDPPPYRSIDRASGALRRGLPSLRRSAGLIH